MPYEFVDIEIPEESWPTVNMDGVTPGRDARNRKKPAFRRAAEH